MTQNGYFIWFKTFPISSHWSGSEWLGMANFPQFATFPIFSHWNGSEWLRTANFTWFAAFPIFSHQSSSEWLRSANFTWFTFPTEVAHTDLKQWKLVKTYISLQILNWSEPNIQNRAHFAELVPESRSAMVTIETDKNFNISADSQSICTELSEQGSIFPRQLKWIQKWLWYDQSWWKHISQ